MEQVYLINTRNNSVTIPQNIKPSAESSEHRVKEVSVTSNAKAAVHNYEECEKSRKYGITERK